MKRFRCYNCVDKNGTPGVDFLTEEKMICPTCGLDGTNPKYARFFAPVKAIHFNPPDPAFAKGKVVQGLDHAACDEKLGIGQGKTHVMLTNVPQVVNCMACQETEAFKESMHQVSFNPEDDFPITIDPKNMVIKAG